MLKDPPKMLKNRPEIVQASQPIWKNPPKILKNPWKHQQKQQKNVGSTSSAGWSSCVCYRRFSHDGRDMPSGVSVSLCRRRCGSSSPFPPPSLPPSGPPPQSSSSCSRSLLNPNHSQLLLHLIDFSVSHISSPWRHQPPVTSSATRSFFFKAKPSKANGNRLRIDQWAELDGSVTSSDCFFSSCFRIASCDMLTGDPVRASTRYPVLEWDPSCQTWDRWGSLSTCWL